MSSLAVNACGQDIQLDPDYAKAHYGRGHTHNSLGEYANAQNDLDKAIQIDPDFTGAYLARGLAYSYLGQSQRAIEDYDKAIQLKPDYANVYYHRGHSYHDLCLRSTVVKTARKVVRYLESAFRTGL